MSKISSQTIELPDFNGIDISDFGVLILQQGEVNSLVIEADEDILPEIKSEVVGEKLHLGLRRRLNWLLFPFKHFDGGSLTYRLTYRHIDTIRASGAVKVEMGSIHSEEFRLDLSGAVSAFGETLSAQTMRYDMSGASKFEVSSITVQDMKANLSGAVAFHCDMLEAQKLDMDMSGSCNGSFCSGAAEKQSFRLSGASKLDAVELKGTEVEIGASGACNASVWAEEKLDMNGSGASKITYRGRPHVSQRMSGACSVRSYQDA